MTSSVRLVPAETLGLKPRMGIARLTKLAFDGEDLNAIWADLVPKLKADNCDVDTAMDLSVVAQLVGQQELGLQLQREAVGVRALYRSPCTARNPRLRILAFGAATDIGGNTPLEFLLEGSGIEIYTLYVVPGQPLPEELPDHDVAFVIVPYSDETRATLDEIQAVLHNWPRPLINLPRKVADLERDRLHKLLVGAPGIEIPATARVDRDDLDDVIQGVSPLGELMPDAEFPLIIRPVGSQAGRGLERLEDLKALAAYLDGCEDGDFFLSRYVDYASDNGQFRKYRVSFVDGRPYACHMAVADQWKLWYLNAEMDTSAEKRDEEARFMRDFDTDFALRHDTALNEIVRRTGLDYFAIDCAETRDGKLLIFEADIAMIVHNMDPPTIFPYKAPQMRKIFAAVADMIERRAGTAPDSRVKAA